MLCILNQIFISFRKNFILITLKIEIFFKKKKIDKENSKSILFGKRKIVKFKTIKCEKLAEFRPLSCDRISNNHFVGKINAIATELFKWINWVFYFLAVYNWKIQYPRGLLISGDKEIDIDNERLQLQLQYLENQRPGIDKSFRYKLLKKIIVLRLVP